MNKDSNPNILCIYSQYSEVSKKIVERIEKYNLSELITMIQADHSFVRNFLSEYLNYVPCILLRHDTHTEIYEGDKALLLINDLIIDHLEEKSVVDKDIMLQSITQSYKEELKRQIDEIKDNIENRYKQEFEAQIKKLSEKNKSSKPKKTKLTMDIMTPIEELNNEDGFEEERDDVSETEDRDNSSKLSAKQKKSRDIVSLAKEMEKAREIIPLKKPM